MIHLSRKRGLPLVSFPADQGKIHLDCSAKPGRVFIVNSRAM